MNGSIRHRGPDDAGIYRDPERHLSIAMRRLAIIDLSGGHQPMLSSDGRYAIVYNGEIFNAPVLRKDLEQQGARFETDHSDTEVLLQLLIREGTACLPKLNGMFAFAFYDKLAGTLLCARDRFGIKPLYFSQTGGRLAFASELKSLLTLPYIEKQVNSESLYHYMSLMYLPERASILKGTERLPAGHFLSYDLTTNKIEIGTFWKPAFKPDTTIPAKEWPDILLDSFRGAVDRWTLSDVPVAASLSGGLDSSGIVGVLAQRGAKIKTYSVGFTGKGEKSWNELPRARAVARHWGTDHHEIELTPESLLEDLVKMVWHLDEPYGGGLPSWSVFKFMAKDVKVGLTGTGGDELFGNYGKWSGLEKGWLSSDPNALVDAARFDERFFQRFYYLSDKDKRATLSAASSRDTAALMFQRFEAGDGPAVRDRIAITDIETQLSEEFLFMTDRFSMAHSLEARTPFLDNEFSDLVMRIPATARTHHKDLKGLLRKTLSPVLVPEIENLPKMGFVIPLKLWLRDQLRPVVEFLLAPERLKQQGFFRPEFYTAFVKPHLEGRADHTNKVWAALMFQIWHMVFVEQGSPDFDLAALTQ